MEWSKMSVFRKVAFIVGILCLIAGITFTILNVMDILTDTDMIEDILDCIYWLSLGIVFWEKKRLFPIICFVLSGFELIFIFI